MGIFGLFVSHSSLTSLKNLSFQEDELVWLDWRFSLRIYFCLQRPSPTCWAIAFRWGNKGFLFLLYPGLRNTWVILCYHCNCDKLKSNLTFLTNLKYPNSIPMQFTNAKVLRLAVNWNYFQASGTYPALLLLTLYL